MLFHAGALLQDGHTVMDLVAQLPYFSPARPLVVGRQAASGNADRDTLATLGRMAQVIAIAAQHPDVQRAALEAIAGVPVLSAETIARAVYAWIKPRIKFELDESIVAAALIGAGLDVAADAELLIAPWQLLAMPKPMGDCDDFSMLAASMLTALGVRARLVVIAADRRDPQQFSHVYPQAQLEDGSWYTIDCSHGPRPGWEAPVYFRKEAWPILAAPVRFRSTGLHGLGAGRSALDDSVIHGSRKQLQLGRGGLNGLGAGYSVLDEQVLKGRSRAGVPGLGDIFTLEGDPGEPVASGFDWGGLLTNGINNIAAPILKAQFGQPAAGTFIQQGPNGSTYYRGNPNAAGANLPFPPNGAGVSGTSWLAVAFAGGAAILLVVLMGRR